MAQGPIPINHAILYFSPGKLDWPSRYWIEVPAHKQGSKLEAELPKEFASLAGEAYATVFDDDGMPSSSVTISSKGVDPFTQPVALWQGDNLWDKARGADAWRTYIHEPLNVTSQPSGGFNIGPGEGKTHFTAVTNSVILASARAKEYAGIRITLNVEKAAGVLHLRLCRYTRSNREQAYIAEINYKPGKETFNLPWSSFIPPAGANTQTYPFDGLVLEGTRSDGSPITVESLELMPKQ
jgi:hypothetical protein